MNTATLLLGILAASLWIAALMSRRSGSERRDVNLMLGIGMVFGVAATAAAF